MTRVGDGRRKAQDVNVVGQALTGTSVMEYDSSVVASQPSTRATHTVTTGTIFRIYNWSFEADNAIGKVELQIAGTAVDSIRFGNSTNTNRISVNYGSSPLEATAGQVVRIQSISGDTGKEFTVSFNGIETVV